MNVLRWSLLAMFALLVSFAPAFGQRVQVQPKGILLGRGEASLLPAEGVEKLKLTAEQKEKYTKIETDYKELVKTAQDKFRAEVQGDRAKAKEAQEKLQADTKKAREDQLAKVEATLTGEQKTVLAQVKVLPAQPNPGVRPQPIQIGGGVGQVLPPAVQNRLQLTDEQKKEVEKLQKEVEAKIMKILTDDQKKQLEQFKKGPIRIQPIQPNPANPRQIQPAVPNVQPAPDVKKD